MDTQTHSQLKFPQGYCTNPNGVIVPTKEGYEHFNFGYDAGYIDGLQSIKDSLAAIECRVKEGFLKKLSVKNQESLSITDKERLDFLLLSMPKSYMDVLFGSSAPRDAIDYGIHKNSAAQPRERE